MFRDRPTTWLCLVPERRIFVMIFRGYMVWICCVFFRYCIIFFMFLYVFQCFVSSIWGYSVNCIQGRIYYIGSEVTGMADRWVVFLKNVFMCPIRSLVNITCCFVVTNCFYVIVSLELLWVVGLHILFHNFWILFFIRAPSCLEMFKIKVLAVSLAAPFSFSFSIMPMTPIEIILIEKIMWKIMY